jgi:acyl carrier protein
MSSQPILEKITEIVREELDDNTIILTTSTEARDVPGWDSLAHVRIVVAIEEAFGVEFSTNLVTGLKNVGDLVRLVEASTSL